MNDQNFQQFRSREIQKIIAEEKRTALEAFRRLDFMDEITRRIELTPGEKKSFPRSLLKPAPLLAIIVMMMISGMVFRIFIFPPSERRNVIAIEQILEQTPAVKRFQKIDSVFPTAAPNLAEQIRKLRKEGNYHQFFSQIIKVFQEV